MGKGMSKLSYDEMAKVFGRLADELIEEYEQLQLPSHEPIPLELYNAHRNRLLEAFAQGGWTELDFDRASW